MRNRDLVKLLSFLVLLVFFGLFLFKKIDLTTSDLGRHLKNGEIILSGNHKEFWGVLHTNFYSYTDTDFPFINHHWGSGVIFFLVWKVVGFTGLSLFYIILSFITLWFFFDAARRVSGLCMAWVITFFLIPLIGSRAEIRPEVFTYLFSGLFFWTITRFRLGQFGRNVLLALPVVEVIWVNLHIGFIFGLAIVGAFWLGETIRIKSYRRTFDYFWVMAFCVFACLFNPSGLLGVLAPFKIFQNYGYRVLENQSVFFLEKVGLNFNLPFFLYKASSIMLIATLIIIAILKRNELRWINFFLGLSFLILTLSGIRHFPIFGLIMIPVFSDNLRVIVGLLKKGKDIFATLVFAGLIGISLFQANQIIRERVGTFGMGLGEGNSGSAEFFKDNKIDGPVFNNYDIGSFLIYYLFPSERVFVDNRPEAYGPGFFDEAYIMPLEKKDAWEQLLKQYNFNVIYFAYHDATPWGQAFLSEMVFDKDWAPVYVDSYALILVRRNDINGDLIKKFEVPESYFKVRK